MGGRSGIVELKSLEETHFFGKKVAEMLPPGSLLALFGPLGSGKTSFVQGLALGLKIDTPIQSPTFTYLNLYNEGNLTLYHFDLYRLKSSSDFFAMGFEEYFDFGGIVAIEWPERLGGDLPPQALSLTFSYSNKGRNVHLSSRFESDLIDSIVSWD